MKINKSSTMKFALLCTVVLGAMLAFSNNAKALTIGDAHELGFVNFGIPSGDADRLIYVNHLIGMALGTSDKADGQTYFRSNNSFGQLPQAVLAGHVNGTSIAIKQSYTGCLRCLTVRIRNNPVRQQFRKASKHRNASVLVGKFTAETEAQEFAHRLPYLGRNLL